MSDSVKKPKANKLRGAINIMLCSDEWLAANLAGRCDMIEALYLSLTAPRRASLTSRMW